MQVSIWILQRAGVQSTTSLLMHRFEINTLQQHAHLNAAQLKLSKKVLIITKTMNPATMPHRQLQWSHESQILSILMENRPSKTEWHTELHQRVTPVHSGSLFACWVLVARIIESQFFSIYLFFVVVLFLLDVFSLHGFCFNVNLIIKLEIFLGDDIKREAIYWITESGSCQCALVEQVLRLQVNKLAVIMSFTSSMNSAHFFLNPLFFS